MKVAVIKYNAGNIRSVDYALKRLGVEAVITSDKEVLKAADKVIFPGVGEAETTMLHLKESGMDRFIKELRQPVPITSMYPMTSHCVMAVSTPNATPS